MKTLLLFLIAVTTVLPQILAEVKLADSVVKLIAKHRETCIKRTNVNSELVEKARKGHFSPNPDFRKHVYCVSREMSFQDHHGNLKPDVIKTHMMNVFDNNQVVVDDLCKACAQRHPDPVEVAVSMFKCLHDKKGLVLL